MRRVVLGSLASALAFLCVGCTDPDDTHTGGGVLEVPDKQVDFGTACPKPSDPKYRIELQTRSIKLKNVGLGALSLNKFEVDAAARDAFLIDPAKVPGGIDALSEVEIPVTFAPLQGGTIVAELSVVVDEEAPVKVKLLGEGRGLPAVPGLAMNCPGGLIDMDACETPNPNLFYKETPIGHPRVMEVKVTNTGCPNLEIKSVKVETAEGDPEAPPVDPTTFALADGQKTELTVYGGGAADVIRVVFNPKGADVYNGTLTFETNDPDRPSIAMPLKGVGVEPQIVVETAKGCGYCPTCADPFAKMDAQCCDFKPKAPATCTGKFTLKNVGGQELTIDEIKLQTGNAMFEIVTKPAAGTTIPARGKLEDAIEIKYTAKPNKESDKLVIATTAGTAEAEIRGGSPAEIDSDPRGIFTFGSQLDVAREYFQLIQIGNGKFGPTAGALASTYNQQLPLEISKVELDDPRGAMTLVPVETKGCDGLATFQLASVDQILEGKRKYLCAKFKPAGTGGGIYRAELRLTSNDPLYSTPYQLTLNADTVCDPAPAAVVTFKVPGSTCQIDSECVGANKKCGEDHVCYDTSDNYSIDLAKIGDAAREIVLSGAESYDSMPNPQNPDPNTGFPMCDKHAFDQIETWEWTKLSTAGSITTDPAKKTPTTTLTYSSTGTYTIELVVTDKTGNRSTKKRVTVSVSKSN